jgi:hypothetical protein
VAKTHSTCYILISSTSFFSEKGKLLERVGRKTVSPPLLKQEGLSGYQKEPLMKQSIFALVFAVGLCSSNIGWCESKTFQLGFTIPVLVGINTPKSNSQSQDQISQTQNMVRDHKMVSMTTFVEP